MKKLFQRKKHDDVGSSPSSSSPSSDRGGPRLASSPYDSTPSGGLPQTGDYPIKGNDTANVLKKKPSRKSSMRSWRSSSGSQQPALFNRSPPPDQYGDHGFSGSPPSSTTRAAEPYGQQSVGQNRWSRSQLPQDFSGMNLGNEGGPFTTTTTTTTTGPVTTVHSSYGMSNGSSPSKSNQPQSLPQRQGFSDVNASSIRPVNPSEVRSVYTSTQPQTQQSSRYAATPSDVQGAYAKNLPPVSANEPKSKTSSTGHGKQYRQPELDGALKMNSSSIPRKEVGTKSSSLTSKGHSRGISDDRALPSAPNESGDMYTHRRADPAPAPAASSILSGNRPFSKDQDALDAQAIVDKAKTSTQDTSVVESYAPAVVHETVHEDIHHIREELIRKEIHTHDVYHRMLPVIDVEVLPARHFLPVEGGGLVEVRADEVPGRGNNWVLAETVSKIPSDQPAPRGATNFTARKFPGREGDEVKYTASEGHEKTEQTWVHPPELETGARDTGQSWPMVFGETAPEQGTYGYKPPGTGKKRSAKRVSMTSGMTG